jgi:hypothetical protein
MASAVLAEIRRLDPERDHQRIVLLSTRCDFPFDTTRALEFALFRSFCVPSISALLHRTGEFERRAQNRYDDTDIIVSELLEWGYDSERGRAALRRMNQIHARFAIANDDFRYVLSTFVFEPVRWNERFGWRHFCDAERLALFYFWREVGRRMNIRELPPTYEEFEAYNIAYERAQFRHVESNRRVGEATLAMFAAWFPRALRPLVRASMLALLDDALLVGFGFARPSPGLCRLVRGALRLRAWVCAHLPPRRRPVLRTEGRHRSYPHGYRTEDLGPLAQPLSDGTVAGDNLQRNVGGA